MITPLSNDDITKLNVTRRNLLLQDIIGLIETGQKEAFSKAKIFHNGKEIKFLDIDFKHDAVFIMNNNLMGIISYCGLLILNNIDIKDTSLSGHKSRVNTSYMFTTSNDARLALNASVITEDDPDCYRVEKYYIKDLVLWNLADHLGTGTDRDKASLAYSTVTLLNERKMYKKLNWLFFTGTKQEYLDIYGDLNIPIYEISTSGYIPKTVVNKGVSDIW